jgi:riboflavin synthase alpha subunit
MFTGIVRGLCEVVAVEDAPGQRRLVLALPAADGWADGLERGASVSVNGVCLTATDIDRLSQRTHAQSEKEARTHTERERERHTDTQT